MFIQINRRDWRSTTDLRAILNWSITVTRATRFWKSSNHFHRLLFLSNQDFSADWSLTLASRLYIFLLVHTHISDVSAHRSMHWSFRSPPPPNLARLREPWPPRLPWAVRATELTSRTSRVQNIFRFHSIDFLDLPLVLSGLFRSRAVLGGGSRKAFIHFPPLSFFFPFFVIRFPALVFFTGLPSFTFTENDTIMTHSLFALPSQFFFVFSNSGQVLASRLISGERIINLEFELIWLLLFGLRFIWERAIC